ncbi:Patellin-6 [Zea mays]|uniref:Patellin-6 n=1 Tax=Zea mays TaxID=4577 RepID=A0A3L6G5E4_MAIZE|nr:Patellin-6 [Zea mays]
MWGVPLNPHSPPPGAADTAAAPALADDERADVVLLKFLRTRDFRARDAHAMLLRCAAWRAEFGTDAVVDEDLGFKELEGVVAYMHGWDRDGHPVCYNAYDVFKDRGMYERAFDDGDRLARFLWWRVKVMERGVRALTLRPAGVNAQSRQQPDPLPLPGQLPGDGGAQELMRPATRAQVFINMSWYFSVLFSMVSPLLTERTKSKFVIAREGNVVETLYKFIWPELVPVQYGGLSRAGELENGPPKSASEFTIEGGEKVFLEIDGIEVFEPLVKLLRLVDGDVKPSMGFLYGELINAKKAIKEAFGNVEIKYKEVMSIIEKKMKNRLDSPLHVAAYMLNPYYSYTNSSIFCDSTIMEKFMLCVETFYHGEDEKAYRAVNDDLDRFQTKQGSFSKIWQGAANALISIQ